MNIQAHPYLSFNGNCREAMNFYKNCFGGELTLQTVAETPIAAQCPTGMQNHIMHSSLVNGELVIMATDMNRPGEGLQPGNDMAIALNFDSEENTRNCHASLSEGGNIIDPLEEKFWGALFGVVQDRFGKVWMLNCERNQQP